MDTILREQLTLILRNNCSLTPVFWTSVVCVGIDSAYFPLVELVLCDEIKGADLNGTKLSYHTIRKWDLSPAHNGAKAPFPIFSSA